MASLRSLALIRKNPATYSFVFGEGTVGHRQFAVSDLHGRGRLNLIRGASLQ
jgi:hypothetical protein